MNTHTDINELKASGKYFAAGVRAAQQGLPDAYGAHFGAQTSLSFARSEFSKGWHSVEALAAALCAYEDAVASNADTSVVLAAFTAYSNLVDAAAERRAAAATAQQAGIAQLKVWCLENYERGADTMVECWDDAEYQELLDDCGGNVADALELLRKLASVYADQQADARYHANS